MNEGLSAIGREFSTDSTTDSCGEPAAFMLWRQDQRAIGELMIDRSRKRPRCIGYVEFVEQLAKPDRSRWFKWLLEDCERTADDAAVSKPRLRKVLEALEDLINVLDPGGDRVRSLVSPGHKAPGEAAPSP